jgi:hypothetical protein
MNVPAMNESKSTAGLFYAFAAHSAGLAEPAEAPEDGAFARFSAQRTEMIEPS